MSVVKSFPSFIIFFLGAGSLYFAEFWLSKIGSNTQVADWTLLKSIVLVGGQFALFGLDQVVVREPHSKVPLIRTSILLVGTVSLFSVFILGSFDRTDSLAVKASIALFFYALSMLVFAKGRSADRMALAHAGRDGWKIFFLLFILVSVFFNFDLNLPLFLVAAFSLSIIPLFWVLKLRKEDAKQYHTDVVSIRSAFRTGLPFYLAAISLAIGAYGELILLNIFAIDSDIANYFRLALLFSYPSLILTTFIGGILAVWIRDNHRLADKIHSVSLIKLLLLSLLICPVLIAGGQIVSIIFNGSALAIGPAVLLLAWAGSIRLVAAISTSGLTVIASRKILDKLTIYYVVLGICCMLVLGLLLSVGANSIISTTAIVSTLWTFRFLIAYIHLQTELTTSLSRHTTGTPHEKTDNLE